MFLLFKSMGTIIPLAFTGPSIYREIYLHRRSVWLYLYITTLNCLLRFIILVDILLFLCHWNQAVRLVSCQVKGISAKFDTVCRLVTCSRRSLRSEHHNKARILSWRFFEWNYPGIWRDSTKYECDIIAYPPSKTTTSKCHSYKISVDMSSVCEVNL